jgi:WD40 repeat protein
LLRGDLDWIVMKALEKERARRYPTANGLANDLERHLKEEPVSAGPPQVTYRLRKFIRRHRAAVAAGTGMVVALMAGLLLATVAFLHAREQRDRALLAERTADQERRLALAEGQRARLGELRARQISYASDMSLALHSLDNSNLGRTLQLLNRHRSLAGQNDLRGWEWRYLWQQCQGGALFELCKHSNSVFSVAGSPDGAWLAVGGFDGALQVWDLLARRLAATLQEQAPYCVAAFCPTGKLLAAVGTDGTVTLWEWPGAIALGRLETDGPIRSLSFSADGQKLAGYSAAGTVWVWDPETRRPLNSLKGFGVAQFHGGEAVLSAKGDWVAVGIADGCIRVVDTVTGQELARWQAHPESILALAVSPDDRFLASGAGFTDSSVRLWDARSGALVTNLVGHQAWVSAVVFLPDGKTLASASADQTIRLWDWQQGRATAVLRGSLHEVWSLASLAKSDTLVSGAKDGKVQVWRPKEAPSSGACAAPPLSVHMTAFTGDGAEWVGLLTSGIVVCGHAAAPQSWQPIEALGRDNRAVACRQKDGLLAVATGAGTVTLWDLKRQSVVTNLATADLTPRLGALQFTADGKYLVRARSSSAIAVWETEFWSITASWSTENEELGSIGLSPDGRFLAAGGKVTRVWDLMTGRRVVSFQAHRQPTDTLAFSPDGKVLATGSQEGVAKLWEVGAWRELATLHGHLLGVHALAFSPDSQRLATGSVDRESVKLWDLATTSEVLNLSLPRELVGTLAFSPDGSTLMAVVSGPGVRFWRAPAWAEIAAAEMARSR